MGIQPPTRSPRCSSHAYSTSSTPPFAKCSGPPTRKPASPPTEAAATATSTTPPSPAEGTLELWREWAPIIRSFAYPVALVAHNGMTPNDLPADADALFIGGSDEWRDAPSTHELIQAAKQRGMWIHVGRVNSNKRIRHWRTLGADSSDGTHSAFAGLQNTVRLFNQSLAEQPLFPTTFDTLDARRPS